MATQVRITGLVRISDDLRRELARPITADRRDELRSQVDQTLRQVRQILADRRAGVQHLPLPSQRAYRFLASVQWDNLLIGEPAPEKPAPAPTTSWSGLSRFIEYATDALAFDVAADHYRQVAESISITSRRIELSIRRDNLSPEELTPATRAQRGWLAFFSQPDRFDAYLQSRKTASRLIDASAAGHRGFPPPILIRFCPMSGIFKCAHVRGRSILSLPTPMIVFDESGFAALAALIFTRPRDSRQRVIDLMTAEAYQSVRADIEALGGIVEHSRGAAHDLQESFNRINADFFGGEMPRPRLTWNRTLTGRKFGHFDFVRDTLMVSQTLDSPKVPSFVVDYLVFHELLHKFHGLHWVNGRGYAHTPEFYRDEKRFPRHAEAEAVLTELAREMR